MAKSTGGIKKKSFKGYIGNMKSEYTTFTKALEILTDTLENEFWVEKYEGNPAWNGIDAKKWSKKMVNNQNSLVKKLNRIDAVIKHMDSDYAKHKNK